MAKIGCPSYCAQSGGTRKPSDEATSFGKRAALPRRFGGRARRGRQSGASFNQDAMMCINGVPSCSLPNCTLSRPLLKSVVLKPGSVSDAVGSPAFVMCIVSPAKPAAPSLSDVSTSLNVKVPNTVASSPLWKPLSVLQISALGLRSSTKNVSVPLPPVRKFEPYHRPARCSRHAPVSHHRRGRRASSETLILTEFWSE